MARLPGGIGPGIYNSTGFEHRVPVHMSFLFLADLIIALHMPCKLVGSYFLCCW